MSKVCRRLIVPDSVRVHRYQSLPEFAPTVLFFSGGSALNKIARRLKYYTHHSIHMVTPFDSGGSSAILRHAFKMPAVGDLRSRMMALADETVLGLPDVYDLFRYRLALKGNQSDLRDELNALVSGQHPLMQPIVAPMATLIISQLERLRDALPDSFDLRGASVGNLIIAGGYLSQQYQLDPIIFLFSRLVKTLGEVTTIVDDTCHLAVLLESGETVLGQHLITGKEQAALISPIKEIWLNQGLEHVSTAQVQLAPDRVQRIQNAELICYPPGSFFTSVVANLLVTGVASAIQANDNPKVYLPNLGEDPEQLGWPLMRRVEFLLTLLSGRPEANLMEPVLNWLLLDDHYDYGVVDEAVLAAWGVQVIRTPLIGQKTERYEETLVVEALLSFT